MCFQLSRQKIQLEKKNDEEYEEYEEILNNSKMHENFMYFVKEMNEEKPKSSEDIFKVDSHLIDSNFFN
jgi:hypothetical protein